MISSQASSLMLKPFFPNLRPPAISRPATPLSGTFYGHENSNFIHIFKVARPWLLHSKEISKCGHPLSIFISYSQECSDSGDFPKFAVDGSKVKVRVSLAYKWVEPARVICFRQMVAGTGNDGLEDGHKVKIHYKLYDNHPNEVRYSTYSKHDPETIGPGKNKICQGLYEGIVGMRLGETRRIVLPPSWATLLSYAFLLWIFCLILFFRQVNIN